MARGIQPYAGRTPKAAHRDAQGVLCCEQLNEYTRNGDRQGDRTDRQIQFQHELLEFPVAREEYLGERLRTNMFSDFQSSASC